MMNLKQKHKTLLIVALLGLGSCNRASTEPKLRTETKSLVPLSAVWANDGLDKITHEELRASQGGESSVINSVWDGQNINLFGAKNEVVSFNLVLESATQTAGEIHLTMPTLTGPNNFALRSGALDNTALFNWTEREIEAFLIKYLPIKGLSKLSYETYDERHIPRRLRRPFAGEGRASGVWTDRPDHDKEYPDIAVPIERNKGIFSIAKEQNQSIWFDVYIPKEAPPGAYLGKISLSTESSLITEIPIHLEVKSFTLPDLPNAKTMVNLGYSDIGKRYTGEKFPPAGSNAEISLKKIRDLHFLLAHRHKIALIDSDPGPSPAPLDRPRPEWSPRLTGELFSKANGYAGPGAGVGNSVYSIGTYGSWSWKQNVTKESMWAHANGWVNWFAANAPQTEYFLYLEDESTHFDDMQKWAQWLNQNPGAGKRLRSLATIPLPQAMEKVPALSIPTSWFTVGPTRAWDEAYTNARKAAPPKLIYSYNGKRPSNGSFAIEDDGVSLREIAWAQYKKGIDRWYFWESTYYNDFQGGRGETNVFKNAMTIGAPPTMDPVLGETSWNHSNGDGLLFYPGTDTVYPESSLGINGPIASLRLKHWRRGIQDVDYLVLANAIDPSATRKIVEKMVPKALWEYGVNDAKDPSWVKSDISWSTNPDDWEQARRNLANIIEGKTAPGSSTKTN